MQKFCVTVSVEQSAVRAHKFELFSVPSETALGTALMLEGIELCFDCFLFYIFWINFYL